jgi:hypothetical protein
MRERDRLGWDQPVTADPGYDPLPETVAVTRVAVLAGPHWNPGGGMFPSTSLLRLQALSAAS